MKEKILNWFKFDRQFDSGVRIYHEFGSNQMLKRLFNHQGNNPYNYQLLQDELMKLSDVHPDEIRHLLSVPVTEYKKTQVGKPEQAAEVKLPPEPVITTLEELKTDLPEEAKKALRLRDEFPFLRDKDCPAELKILVADMLTSFDKYKQAHEALFTAENEAELLKFSQETVENYLENRQIWEELNYYKENGKILGTHPIFAEMQELESLKAMKPSELAKKKANLRSNISQVKKSIDKGDHPGLLFERQERLKSKERLLAQVEKLLEKA